MATKHVRFSSGAFCVNQFPGFDITPSQDHFALALDLGEPVHDLIHAGDFILVGHGTVTTTVTDTVTPLGAVGGTTITGVMAHAILE